MKCNSALHLFIQRKALSSPFAPMGNKRIYVYNDGSVIGRILNISSLYARNGSKFSSRNVDKRTSSLTSSFAKMDSFFIEVQRMNPTSLISIARYAESDITLSNGQVLPQEIFTAAPSYGVNRDLDLFENPDTFDPWRFVRLRDEAEELPWANVAIVNICLSSFEDLLNLNSW